MATIKNILYSIPHISTGQLISCNISASHSSSTTVAVIETLSSGFSLSEHIDISIGDSSTGLVRVFTGYVKSVEKSIPNNVYTITANDDLIRAIDYFIVNGDPMHPMEFASPIWDYELIPSVLLVAGLSNVDSTSEYSTGFQFGISNPFKISQISAYDFCRSIADLLVMSLWCDTTGRIHFRSRRPYPMLVDDHISGWHQDTPIAGYTVNDTNILNISKNINNVNLRNRIIVWGYGNIYGEASDDSIDSFHWKTAALGGQDVLDTQEMVDDTANFNLKMLNRLTESLSATVIGNPALQPFNTVVVNSSKMGISNTQYYIYSAEHFVSSSGYTTKLELKKS